MNRRTLYRRSFFLFTALLLAGCRGYVLQHHSDPELPVIADAFFIGTDACIPCHGDVHRRYRSSVHARSNPATGSTGFRGCESCHGPGSIHAQTKGAPGTIIQFAALSPEAGSSVCLQCHEHDAAAQWLGSRHGMSGIGCTQCHRAHTATSAEDPALCFSCHQEKKSRFLLPSHHPVSEKKMRCSSCHDVHSAERAALKDHQINERCLACHAQYQGPFVYEHPPVVEDCTICHEPHGTVVNNLLRQSEPFLCLRCHTGHKPNPKTGQHPSMGAFMTSCAQCHAQIHGSDLPSQVKGDGLTR